MNWIKRKIEEFIVTAVMSGIQIGGWCGCCGVWIADCLVERIWPYTVCDKCIGGNDG